MVDRIHVRAGRWMRVHAVPIVATAVVLALALYNDFHRSLWIDEAYSLDTARRSLSGTFRETLHFELQPPLYFSLLNLWLRISPAIEFARLLSTIAVVAAIWVLDRLGRLLDLGRSWALLPLLAALCPAVIWAASETRAYALAFLFTSIATYHFIAAWVADADHPRRHAALYVVFSYLSVMTLYYAGFLLAGQLLAGLFAGRRRKALLAAFAVLAVALLPWAPVILGQMASVDNYRSAIPLGSGLGIPLAAAALAAKALPQQVLFPGAAALGRASGLGLLLLFVVGVGVARTAARKALTRAETTLALMSVVPFVVLVSLQISNLALVERRHFLVVTLSVLLLLCLLVREIPTRALSRALGVFLVLVFAAAAYSYQRHVGSPSDFRSAVAFLTSSEGAGEPILTFTADNVLPIRYYYRGRNSVHGVPADVTMGPTYWDEMRVRGPDQLRSRIDALVAPGQSFWLVLRPDKSFGVLGGAIVERFVSDSLETLRSRAFPGVRVVQLRRPVAPRPLTGAARANRATLPGRQ